MVCDFTMGEKMIYCHVSLPIDCCKSKTNIAIRKREKSKMKLASRIVCTGISKSTLEPENIFTCKE